MKKLLTAQDIFEAPIGGEFARLNFPPEADLIASIEQGE